MSIGTDRINEKDSFEVQFSFFDPDGEPVVPQSISYRVDCVTTGAEILVDTPISPVVASGLIDITTLETTLEDQENLTELRRVSVVCVYGVNKRVMRQYYFNVMNTGSESA